MNLGSISNLFSTRGKQSPTLMKLYLGTFRRMQICTWHLRTCMSASGKTVDDEIRSTTTNDLRVNGVRIFCSEILLFRFEVKRNLKHFLHCVMNENEKWILKENLDNIMNLNLKRFYKFTETCNILKLFSNKKGKFYNISFNSFSFGNGETGRYCHSKAM